MEGVLDALELAACVVDHEGQVVFANTGWRELQDAVGDVESHHLAPAHVLDGFADADEATRDAIARGVREVLGGLADRFALDYASAAPGGPPRWSHVVVTPAEDGAVVAHQDVSDRVQAVRRVTALGELATTIAAGAGLGAAFTSAARHACTLLGASAAAVVRYDGGVDATVLAAWTQGGATLPPDTPIELNEAEAAGLRAAARGATRQRHFAGVPSTATRLGYRSSIVAPVYVDGLVWGMLIAGWREPDVHREAVEVLEAIAELAAIAVMRERDRAALEHQASTDPLTGLANRRAFHDRLDQEVARARRHGRPLSLALVDIDHFKAFNDTEGHLVGDRVLVAVAEALRTASRAADLPARLGGDEFVVVLPEVDEPGALAFAERLRQAVASTEPRPSTRTVSSSVGVAALQDADDATRLLHRADQALYRAKAGGRSRAAAWQPQP